MSKKKKMDQKKQKITDQVVPEQVEKNQADENEDFLSDISDLREQLMISQEREKRSLADYQNLLRRVENERSQVVRFANQQLLESLLPVFNHLKKAADQLEDQGLEMVINQLKQVLSEEGVEEIEALGKKFDLETMEAVDRLGEGEIVIDVLQPGYKLKDKILSHAKVILGDKKQLQKK